ncbi:MAG: hypothetical protein IJT31_02125 [Oscillibacter sp.]|nr:hypothetical protein [Oscillibacter sp.]
MSVPKPTPSFLDGLERFKVIDGRMTWRDKSRYYQWDELHGEIEVYNKRGFHLGALDAVSGKLIKEAERGRKIHV